MKWQRTTYLSLVYGFLYIPIILIVAWSFNDAQYSLLWHGFTTKWYSSLFHNPLILTVTWHSILLGLIAATLACVIGTLASLCLLRYRFFGKKLMHGLLFMMIVAPDIIIAVAMVILFRYLNLTLGFTTLLISHVTFCVPFVAITVLSRMSSFNKNLVEAAKDMGASEKTIFTQVLLPLMWPAILAAWVLAFSLSVDDVIISYFVTGPSFQILPLTIYSMVKVGVTPEVNALCTLLLGITIAIIVLAQWIGKKR